MNTHLFLIVNLVRLASNLILSDYEQCHVPLGMESGAIADNDLTSSSTHDATSVGPQMARIRMELEGGAWCPDKPIGPKSYEYIQIDLHRLVFLTAIETQGRFDNGQGNEYVESYQIQYQRESNSSLWITYQNKKTNKTILKGNINTYTAEKRLLSIPIVAQRVRILPYSSRWRTVCMRVELYGCPFHGGVISYKTSPSIDNDSSYDGGLGKLTDGIIGGNESPTLAWNRSPVSIEFLFDTSRSFKTIRIYSMNNKYRSIVLKFDHSPPIIHQISPTTTSSSTVFLDTVPLDDRVTRAVGKRLEISFEFDNEFLFLTEVVFDNEPVTIVNATNCLTACSSSTRNLTLIPSTSRTLSIFPFEWLASLIISTVCLGFILLLVFFVFCLRRCRHLREETNLYYKCSPCTIETDQNPIQTKNNYDDMTSMGSYIYPITSTTSLLHTSSPSSLFKSEQYTMHYASSDVEHCTSKVISLFNCIALQETSRSNCIESFPACVDEEKLISLYKISQSKFGEIFFGKYQSKSVVIKMLKNNFHGAFRERFLSELNILSRVNHRNIACVCAIQLDSLYFVQEYSDYGTLQDYFRTQCNEFTFHKMNIHFSYQLSNALEYLSDFNLIHNDIASRNCLFFSDATIKLTDCAMALSKYEHEYWLCTNGEKIPLRWIAPEALTNKTTSKSDLYSFAVTLWEFWSRCLYLPHILLKNEELYQYLILQKSSSQLDVPDEYVFRLPQPSDCPKEIYDLLCECWHIDPTKRPNISDIVLYFRRQISASPL